MVLGLLGLLENMLIKQVCVPFSSLSKDGYLWDQCEKKLMFKKAMFSALELIFNHNVIHKNIKLAQAPPSLILVPYKDNS